MRYRGLIALAMLVLGGMSPASATMLISDDRGGQIGRYLQAFAALRSSGENVVIDGECYSACTMVLGLIPHERICATPRARLGFHAAWMPDDSGRAVTSAAGTQALWSIYPSRVRAWILRHGGLSRRMIFLQGHDLYGIVQSCGATRSVEARRSHRRLAHSGRYDTANASGSRR